MRAADGPEDVTGVLRGRMVEQLIAEGAIRSPEVEAALRTVPRHLFTPGLSPSAAYAPGDALAVKRDRHGVVISSVSAPNIQALMLEQARVRPGDRVLEIGSGGCNAAYLSLLVGPDGAVTTLDFDQDVVDRARRCLAAAGVHGVDVRRADGEYGAADAAPFDAIVVTVAAWDIPPAWVEQLADDGRLVVPLRLCGLTHSIAFERRGDHLASSSAELCGFVAMQGAGEHREAAVFLRGGEVALRFEDAPPVAVEELDRALAGPRAEAWSGVFAAAWERLEPLYLRLAGTLPGACRLSVDPALDTGLLAPSDRRSCPAAVDRGSLAHLVLRRTGGLGESGRWELGAHGYGPDAGPLAARIVGQVRAWDAGDRGGPGPQFAAYPAGTPDERLPDGFVAERRHVRLVVRRPGTTAR